MENQSIIKGSYVQKCVFYDFYGLFITWVNLKNSKNHKHYKTSYGLKITALLRELWAKMCFFTIFRIFYGPLKSFMNLKNTKNLKSLVVKEKPWTTMQNAICMHFTIFGISFAYVIA